MLYKIPFTDVLTDAVADQYVTFAGVTVPDTAGERLRLRGIRVGSAEAIPADKSLAIKIKRIEDVSVGTIGTKTAVIPSLVDPGGKAAPFTSGVDYTVEPTTYAAVEIYNIGIPLKTGLVEFFDDDEAPVILRDQMLGLLIAPQDATGIALSGELIVETF